jgi:pimeloyl-ACP methyl ester carboxylesterase
MLAVRAALPDHPGAYPPVVLVHGAANSAGVWTHWQAMLADAGWPSYAIDLRGHGNSTAQDLSNASMKDYADDVILLGRQLDARPAIIGWSMGGLVAMMAAARGLAFACVGLAPSTPTRTRNPAKDIRPGEYDARYYGITSPDPANQPAMPDLDFDERAVALATLCKESAYARGDRAAGVVIESMPCPLLIVTGTADRQWPRERYTGLPLAVEHLEAEGATHWGLVLSRRALTTCVPKVTAWLQDASTGGQNDQ